MTKISRDISSQIKAKIDLSESILLIPHKGVDGDGIGSALALHLVLKSLGKKSTVAISDSEPPSEFRFLPGFSEIKTDFDPADFDLVIFIDHSEFQRSGFLDSKPDFPDLVKRLLVIDHHQVTQSTPDIPDSIIFSDPASPSTSMIIFDLFQFWEITITPQIATCLLLGIYTDTNSFKNENTTSEAIQVSSKLISANADLETITQEFFQHKNSAALKIWGRALSRLKISRHGVAVSALTSQDFSETGTTPESLGGLINDMLRAAKGAKFAMLITERDDQIKISLRSTSFADFDVSKFAGLFGGGGHKKAAGFSIPGHLKTELTWKISS